MRTNSRRAAIAVAIGIGLLAGVVLLASADGGLDVFRVVSVLVLAAGVSRAASGFVLKGLGGADVEDDEGSRY